jgi:integrase
MTAPRNDRKAASLAGTHLFIDERRGIYYWRRTCPRTGRREVRSTGVRRLDLALRAAAKFEDEWDRRKVGLQSLDGWKLELKTLIDGWIESLGDVTEHTRKHARMALTRALDQLSLVRAADLDDVARLGDRLRGLGRREQLSPTTLRRCYQDVLKRFSRYLAGNRRYIDKDPLASWEPVGPKKGKTRERRAFLPDEVARAFLGSAVLDAWHSREWPTLPAFMTFLITAPREGALVALDVDALRPVRSRIYLGEDVGRKRKGAGALDPTTLAELLEYVGDREGPLFLSSTGTRWGKLRLLEAWRAAFGLGLVDAAWPADAPADVELAIEVSRTLAAGKPQVAKGGNPKLMKPETLARIRERERLVMDLADRLRDRWTEGMRGVDIHAFRKSHRTWAMAAGVLPPAIDLQLGHAAGSETEPFEILKIAAGSRTGRQHYLDAGSALFDPKRSAEAVRKLYDEAMATVVASGSLLLPKTTPNVKAAQA